MPRTASSSPPTGSRLARACPTWARWTCWRVTYSSSSPSTRGPSSSCMRASLASPGKPLCFRALRVRARRRWCGRFWTRAPPTTRTSTPCWTQRAASTLTRGRSRYGRRAARKSVSPSNPAVGRTGTRPLPLGLVVLTEYFKGGRWEPRPLGRGELALALSSNTVPARERPAEVLATLARAVSKAEGFRSVRGSAKGAAKALLRLADGSRKGC